MPYDTFGTFKIYKNHKTKFEFRYILYIILYTIFVLSIKALFENPICDIKTNSSQNIPWIYLITPTYTRPAQKAELIRIKQALQNVPNIYWIVIEDSSKKTNLVSQFLEQNIKNYIHLNIETPVGFKLPSEDPKVSWKYPRGVLQRNLGIEWLRNHYIIEQKSAVIYFMDDDNTYHENLFNEMRYTAKVSVWPVGLAGGMMVERPFVNLRTGKVVGWNAAWEKERAFPIDMAGFAVNLGLLISRPKALFSINSRRGYLETDFLTILGITRDQLEPKADLCRRILVWHTKAWPPKMSQEEYLNSIGKRSDEGMFL